MKDITKKIHKAVADMERNSFSFMKEGFDWEQEQDNDMEEIDMEKVYMEVDDLWDAYRETGMRPSDFISEID